MLMWKARLLERGGQKVAKLKEKGLSSQAGTLVISRSILALP